MQLSQSLQQPLVPQAHRQVADRPSFASPLVGREVTQPTDSRTQMIEKRLKNVKALLKDLDLLPSYNQFFQWADPKRARCLKMIAGLTGTAALLAKLVIYTNHLDSRDINFANNMVFDSLLFVSVCIFINEILLKRAEPEESVIKQHVLLIEKKLKIKSMSSLQFYNQIKSAAEKDFEVIDEAFRYLATSWGIKPSNDLASKLISAFIDEVKAVRVREQSESMASFQFASEKLEYFFQERLSSEISEMTNSSSGPALSGMFNELGVRHVESLSDSDHENERTVATRHMAMQAGVTRLYSPGYPFLETERQLKLSVF